MDERLVAAAARNHTSWMRAGALATGGEVIRHGRLRWFAEGEGGGISLPFPRAVSRPALDAVLVDARERGARSVACWATGLEPYDALGERLVARGFEWGWQPHWMAIDLDDLPGDEPDPRVAVVADVPEYDAYGRALLTLTERRPAHTWHALARIDGAWAGRGWAHRVGEHAGIYDMDVPPHVRRRGVGRALTLAVCRAAKAAGARFATLNATAEGELLYRSLGFRSVGRGQTWWRHRRAYS